MAAKKRLKHDLFTPAERDYWKNIHINIDAICDKWEDRYQDELIQLTEKLPDEIIKASLKHYKLSKGPSESETDCLLSSKKASIDFFCLLEFALHNPKSIAQLFKMPIRNKKVNKVAVIKKALEFHNKGVLLEIFISQLQLKMGKGFYNFYFENEIKDKEFSKYEGAVELLTRTLRRYDKNHKIYYYRSSIQTSVGWIFLLLKETSDDIFPAIPTNVRVLKGTYIIINVNHKERKLEINTHSNKEAYRIKDYLARKTKNTLKYSRVSAIYNAVDFLSEIKKEKNTKNELTLTEVEFRDSKIKSAIKVFDQLHKNDIFSQLNILKEKDIIRLEDFSEFKNLSFNYSGLGYKIDVEETPWGQIRLRTSDRNKPKDETLAFKKNFLEKFKVPLDVYLSNADAAIDTRKTARRILDKNTLEASLPKETEDILLDLISLKILDKPTITAKRRCENKKCQKMTWAKGDCPTCGNNLIIEGNYIDLKTNNKASYDFVFNLLSKTKLFSVKRTRKQIDSSSFQLLDLLDKKGNAMSVFLASTTPPEKIIKHYTETGSPLLIILTKFKETLYKDIKGKGFECTDIADIYSVKDDQIRIGQNFSSYIESQKQLWQKKITEKGQNSYHSLLNKGTGYTDQDFEKDIYNLFHEIFIVADRLGGKFAGVPAPDGIISYHNYSLPIKRSCFAWDCKYSMAAKGYQLNDKPEKHRRYINTLKANEKVLLYGNLHTYAIISQNMDLSKYEKFYRRLTTGFRWRGDIVFIEEKTIVNLYKLYKDNEEIIQNNPQLFYKEMYFFFRKIRKVDSMPYKKLSFVRFEELGNKIAGVFKANQINFTFKRDEFL